LKVIKLRKEDHKVGTLFPHWVTSCFVSSNRKDEVIVMFVGRYNVLHKKGSSTWALVITCGEESALTKLDTDNPMQTRYQSGMENNVGVQQRRVSSYALDDERCD
jgi:hypothetical protein